MMSGFSMSGISESSLAMLVQSPVDGHRKEMGASHRAEGPHQERFITVTVFVVPFSTGQ